MISLELESDLALEYRTKAVHKEIQLLKKAVIKHKEGTKVEEHLHLQIEKADLFIERKDKRRQMNDNTLDIAPGNHVLFNFIQHD